MYKLGVTGGIGSGKSTAAKYIQKELKAFLFNADDEAKNHLQRSKPLQKKIINAFGNSVTSEFGQLDFVRLAESAFESKKNQQILNGFIWPEVRLLVENALADAIGKYELFIVDAPLIIEANMTSVYDTVMLITAPKDIRFIRAMARGTLSLEQIETRAKLQLSEEKKRKAADITIDNSGSLEELYISLDQFIHSLKTQISAG